LPMSPALTLEQVRAVVQAAQRQLGRRAA
jgi:hypothetical protein